MSSNDMDALVVSDTEGNYYVLPRELIEVSRVDRDANAAVDSYLEQASAGDQAFTCLGTIALPEESKWTHFTPSVAWPHAVTESGRQHPTHMVMLDKPVISGPEKA
ncbi:hypothetical protein ACGFYQ_40645 [Streptomyces sp. NPDC048258]|uniref:hypothetical protein n=1 Tax=Streptomyces sp. NPDC048258 TaxID=3365527 RepID=UPI0037233684